MSIVHNRIVASFLSFFLLVCAIPCFTQGTATHIVGMKLTYEQDSMGQAQMECVYKYTRNNFRSLKTQSTLLIVQANQEMSKCVPYHQYKVDSAINLKGRNAMAHQEFIKALRTYAVYRGDKCYITREYRKINAKSLMSVMEMEFDPSSIHYEEQTPLFDWEIDMDESKNVLGYTCYKASATLGGRNWIAWFAPVLPVSTGPWKLGELPGLILFATDEKGEHQFEAQVLRPSKSTIFFDKINSQGSSRKKVIDLMRQKQLKPENFDVGFGVISSEFSLLEPW